jgi:ubiquinone/menaquinone biosynthesis C-methylase UbiE
MDRYVKLNIDIHDNAADSYDERHIEIYNPLEQKRLSNVISECKNSMDTVTFPHALDFGSGTGNLSYHLLSNGFKVTAADVSEKSLTILSNKFKKNEKLEIQIIDGQTLSEFPDNKFDLVSTYSVLHHVPDYLGIISEFSRVVKPGGLIYIDHEVCPDYWNQSEAYLKYRKELKESSKKIKNALRKISKVFSIKSWRRLYYRYFLKNGINEEGDIHVYPDDHIEWDKIKEILLENCEIVAEKDYLVCREAEAKIWKKWKDVCHDMRFLIVRKQK